MKVPLSEARKRAKERLAGQTNAVLRVTGSTIRCTDWDIMYGLTEWTTKVTGEMERNMVAVS